MIVQVHRHPHSALVSKSETFPDYYYTPNFNITPQWTPISTKLIFGELVGLWIDKFIEAN